MKFDLQKNTGMAKFALEKKGIPNVKASVVVNLDVSGSAKGLFESGQIQAAFNLLVPLAVLFDDNASLQVFTFADGDSYVTEIQPDATAANFENYIDTNVLGSRKVPKWGSTDYTPVLRSNLRNLGFVKKGLFGGESFKKDNGSGYPAVVFMITDGENYDDHKTMEFLKKCEDEKVGTYFMFIGVGNSTFRNIEKYGAALDNVGFLNIKDLNKFVGQDDIYDLILCEELVEWFKK